MKSLKNLILACIALCCTSGSLLSVPLAFVSQDLREEKSGQSFMFTRPASQNVAMQQSLWHDIIYNKPNRAGGSFQVCGFYHQSRPDDSIARYFLINHKNSLLVAGDGVGAIDVAERDVRAEWLNLPTNFIGAMSADPYQRQAGVFIEYNQDLSFINLPFFENYWISVCIPFITVLNSLNISQSGVKNTGTSPQPQDIIEAFNQPAWLFSKWPDCKSASGLAEICLRFGKAYMNEDFYQIAYYSLFRIPGHEGQNPTFLFDPIVGNNGHWGFGAGVNFQVVINNDTSNYAFCWFLNIENTFFIRSEECRTFDLRDKPWSRYMLFTRQGVNNAPPQFDQIVPGVNILTRQVKVHPYNMADISSGFRYKSNMLEAEIGYNLWLHGREKLELHTRATKDVYGILGTAPGLTASASTIDTLAPNDTIVNPDPAAPPGLIPNFVPINDSEIDLHSGASHTGFVHKVHLAVGAEHKGRRYDYFVGVGCFFEIPHDSDNTALKTVGIWAKAGASF